MTASSLISIAVVVVGAALGAARTGAPMSAQLQSESAEQLRRLVVMLDTRFGADAADQDFGGGIIVAQEPHRLLIATAKHVVRRGQRPASVTARFRWLPDRSFPAALLYASDNDQDVALLAVDSTGLELTADTLLFTVLRPLPLVLNVGVRALGYPRKDAWYEQLLPDWIATLDDDTSIQFDSREIAAGHSGGALVTEELEIVGMVRKDQPPRGEAMRIETLIQHLRDRSFPVNLTSPVESQQPDFAKVSGGPSSDFACALTAAGRPYCWSGQDVLSAVDTRLRFRVISADSGSFCALTPAGVAYCWGSNCCGELGNGTVNETAQQPIAVKTRERLADISHSGGVTCAVTEDGRGYCWGKNNRGQLGDGSQEGRSVPVAIASDIKWRTIQPGGGVTCGLSVEDDAYCWGYGGNGGIGNGRLDDASTPQRIPGGLKFRSIRPGHAVCALTVENALYCWGARDSQDVRVSGEYGGPTPKLLHQSLAVTIHSRRNCAITQGQMLVCWQSRGREPLEFTESKLPVDLTSITDNPLPCGLSSDRDIWCLTGLNPPSRFFPAEKWRQVVVTVCPDGKVRRDVPGLSPSMIAGTSLGDYAASRLARLVPTEIVSVFSERLIQFRTYLSQIPERYVGCRLSFQEYDWVRAQAKDIGVTEAELARLAHLGPTPGNWILDPSSEPPVTPDDKREIARLVESYGQRVSTLLAEGWRASRSK